MTTLICLPAHILDADISPRAREVLMLLASQTSAAEPALWICQKTIANRLRCSVATVARSIAKLLEAKLIAETGKLHEGKYKFYHVRWSSRENLKAVEKKIKQPVRKIRAEENPPTPFFKGGKEVLLPMEQEICPPLEKGAGVFSSDFSSGNPPASTSTLSPSPMLKDNRIAYHAEIARQKWEENRRKYRAELLSMR